MAKRKKGKKAKNRRARKKKKSFIRGLRRFILRLTVLSFLLVLAFILSVYAGFWGPLPSASELGNIQQSKASLVYANDQSLIGTIYAVNRDPIPYQDLPPHLLDALVATEDQRFYEHSGIDLRSLARVLIKSIILQDRSAGGGSTLTQQLVKNLYGRPDYGHLSLAVNKCREMILAWRLEQIYSKKEILALYLNTVSFSENTYGISAGSRRFFNCVPRDLKVEQAAVLVGLLKANTYYNPRLNPENARERRNLVLDLMTRQGYLSAAESDSLQGLALNLQYRNLDLEGPAPYFLAQVRKELEEILAGITKAQGGSWDARQDGLRIYTSLDAQNQRALQKAFREHLAQWQKKFDQHWQRRQPWQQQPSFFDRKLHQTKAYKQLAARDLSEAEIYQALERKKSMELYHPAGNKMGQYSSIDSLAHYLKLLRGGTLIIDPRDGAVRSWCGGPDYRYLPYDANLARHTMASTVKPIVIAAALKNGYEPCDYVSAERRRYTEYDNWSPRNYDDNYEGQYSMQGLLKKSVNTATVAWYLKLGGAKVEAMAHDLGIGDEWKDGPSAALGTNALSPIALARAYSAFANDGQLVEPYFIERIETAEGQLLYQHPKMAGPRVLKVEEARSINAFLQAVVREGTARSLKNVYGANYPWAAKTGTSQNYADAWFVAYRPDLVSVTWMGGENPLIRFRSGSLGSGSAMALPVFGRFLKLREAALAPAAWPKIAPPLQAKLDCPDYREEGLIDELRDLFKKKPGEKVKADQKEADAEEKESWWSRIFKSKKK